jgi:hypothetical protein
MQPRLDPISPQQQAELARIVESPIVLLSGKRVGVIDPKVMAKQDHLDAYQVVNGQTIPVEIVSFILFRVPNEGDPYQANNPTGKFNSETKRIVEMASINDRFQFMDVKCRIKGGNMPVNAESLDFVIKGTPPQYITKKDSIEPIFATVDDVAEYTGGRDSMFRFLGRNIKYPAEARQSKIEGTIYLGFVVEKDGSLTDIKVKKNIPVSSTVTDTIQQFLPETSKTVTKVIQHQDETCAEEAMRVVKMMPKWKPAKHKGAFVRSSYILPIKFKLE